MSASLRPLPRHQEMVDAMLGRDTRYEGLFYTAVKTTGIFCRPSCPARKPDPRNVRFYATPEEALLAGFRPCLRCRPLEPLGAMPDWVARAIDLGAASDRGRLSTRELAENGVDPDRLRAWFKQNYGASFAAILRSRRIARALGAMDAGAGALEAGYDAGYESASGFSAARDRFARRFPAREPAWVASLTSRLGPMVCVLTRRGIALLEFLDRPALPDELDQLQSRHGLVLSIERQPLAATLQAQLDQYFAGERRRFELPLDLRGSAFDQRVWQALLEIPPGEVRSYGEMAAALGAPGASRAVGAANGRNRIAILVPCHRVLASDGGLGGYGGGLPRKRFLLDLEAGDVPALRQARLFEPA